VQVNVKRFFSVTSLREEGCSEVHTDLMSYAEWVLMLCECKEIDRRVGGCSPHAGVNIHVYLVL